MSYELYKVLHLLGILAVFTTLGGLAMIGIRGGTNDETKPLRKPLAMVHGIALVVVLVAGFGLMARKGMMSSAMPLWIYLKIAIWLVLGGAVAFVRKTPAIGKLWYVLLPLVGAVAAYLAVYHPGSPA